LSVSIDQVRSALKESYRIKRSVGRGGMAVVYLADPVPDGEPVAVKVFDPVFQATKWSARFHREIKLLQELHHPSIQPLLASSEVGKLVYYVMPFANGGSLEDRLRTPCRFSLQETVDTARPIANALDYAHAHNVVHRDIKPDNILFHDGRALLCDFGIARAIKQAGGEFLTSIGVRLGTPTYMSPEQAIGVREIDGRSNTYSLACVVYEMLVGEPVFTGISDRVVMSKHADQSPPYARVVRPDLQQHVEGAIQQALAKKPEERPGSGGEFVRRLVGG
jgi:serine/threonine-protein kinase